MASQLNTRIKLLFR